MFEIPEVRRWIQAAVQEVVVLPYFLSFETWAQGIRTIVTCLCRTTRIDSDTVFLKNDPNLIAFMQTQFLGLNQFTDRLGFGLDVNR